MSGSSVGRVVAAAIVLTAVLGGGAMYWLQAHAFYERSEGGALALTPAGGGAPVAVAVEALRSIDAGSSPLRYRACFAHALDPADFAPHPAPEPTVGPGWFDCYDAAATAAAIEAGEAVAVTAARNVTYGVDRVAALWPDRGVAWHQLNPCGETVYAGREPPPGCPPPPAPYRD